VKPLSQFFSSFKFFIISSFNHSFFPSFLLFFFTLFLFTIFISCKDSGTNPTPAIKTPREMTWTSETITSPDPTSIQVLPENLLVFSTSDMWLVCWSDVARGLIWHYNGSQWRESNIAADVGGMRVNDIAGYSSNDLWACGYSGDYIFLAHYDGMRWTRKEDIFLKGELLDMIKDSNGNLWACGRNGVILKYDGKKWTTDIIELNLSNDISYWLKSVEYYNGKIYVLASTASKITLKEKYYYLYRSTNNWIVADTMTFGIDKIKWGIYGLHSGRNNDLYSYGLEGVWKYSNDHWNSIFALSYQIYDMCAVNSNYMFAAGPFCNLFCYDGTAWDNISSLFKVTDPNLVFNNVWSDGYETIVVGYGVIEGVQKTIIWHGK
jgi:hypothetical protein